MLVKTHKLNYDNIICNATNVNIHSVVRTSGDYHWKQKFLFAPLFSSKRTNMGGGGNT